MYFSNEYCDMYLALGAAQNNRLLVVQLYNESYSKGRPLTTDFGASAFKLARIIPGKRQTKRTVANVYCVIDNPRISVRRVETNLNIPFKTVKREIRDEKSHPYHFIKI